MRARIHEASAMRDKRHDFPGNIGRVRRAIVLAVIGAALGGSSLAGCRTVSERDASAREWQRSQCNQIIRDEDRKRCLERVDSEYGTAR
jgi:hypothetical protein